MAHGLSGATIDVTHATRTSCGRGVLRTDVVGDATTVVPTARDVEVELAGGGVVAIVPPERLVDLKYRQPRADDQLADVHGIAMAKSCRALEGSVAGDGEGARDDLLRAVVVGVPRRGRVAALASGRGVPWGVAVEKPGLGQLTIPPIVRKYRQTGVVPSLLDDARPPGRGLAGAQVTDEGHATVVAIKPVAKAVAPAANSAAGHRIVDRGQFLSRRPIEHGQVLRPG